MTHEIRKVSKIVDELNTYLLMIGLKKIKTMILREDTGFKIQFKLYDYDFNCPKIQNMIDYLSYPRQSEMEEYYWELAGESDRETELSLIGIMTDSLDVEYSNSKLIITLYRSKQH